MRWAVLAILLTGVLWTIPGGVALAQATSSSDRQVSTTAAPAPGAYWPGWLGPKRNGWVDDFRPPKRWPSKLKKSWQVKVGTGYGSPLVAGDRVYQHARQGEDEVLWCFDLKTGDVKWRKSYPAPFKIGGGGDYHGKGPKSSPVMADGRIFTMSITGKLVAWDAASGKRLWNRDYDSRFQKSHPYWGAATSPIVDGKRVIVHFGTDERGTLVALDVATGKELWSQGKDGPSYSSPLLVEIHGVLQVVEWNHQALVGVDAGSGKLLWEYPFPHVGSDQNMPTPSFHGGRVFLGGENRGIVGLEPQLQGGSWSVKVLWHQKKVALDMSSAVVNDKLMYGFSHYGQGRLFCLDIKTGKVLWQGPGRTGRNVMFLAIPQHVVALIDNGQLKIVAATGRGFRVAATYRVAEGGTWAPPVLLNDGFLIKDKDSLTLWSLTDSKSPSTAAVASGDGVARAGGLNQRAQAKQKNQQKRKNVARRIRVTAWFDKQFLEDGTAYRRRAKEFGDWTRSKLRVEVIKQLKGLSATSHKAASADLDKLVDAGTISDLRRYWIINGFTCTTTTAGLPALRKVAGVKEVYVAGPARASRPASRGTAVSVAVAEKPKFDPDRYQHPWYIRYLQADRAWKELGVTGRGTLNVVHDFNFVYSQNVTGNLYRNPGETAGNGKDDDGNGLIDDVHGYNFDQHNANLTQVPVGRGDFNPRAQHGFMCAAIICGTGAKGRKYEFGIAPEGTWTGVIASGRLEAAIEWAIEQGADTYSMSFSIPGLGEYRSHWRKVMEHGSFCGICFVSGAGNFAQQARVPVQMRTPEDIPDAVFAAAGVQRNFSRTPFSSKGPVEWKTRHYQGGRVQKPEVCAFNMGLPQLWLNGTTRPGGLNGNSFAGPMFCGSIALMLSADPDLLPWDLQQIITSTATDVAAEGVDDETGHGLINCYRAVREVLRRKAIREGKDPKRFAGRQQGDTLDIESIKLRLKSSRVQVGRLQPGGQAAKLGVKPGDVLVSYHGRKIASRRDVLAAKRKAVTDKAEKVAVVFSRGGQLINREFTTAAIGFVPQVVFDAPTFK